MEDRGELMRSWTPDQVKEFLIKNKIKPTHAQALYEEEVPGEFLFTSEINDFRDLELKIPRWELILIIKAKENYLKGIDNQKNNTKKEEQQIPRKFGEPASKDIKYKVGSILPCENTQFSLEEPIREFKAFYLDKPMEKEDEEKAFIERLGKFAAACINSRYNGTIYFGVTDSKDGTSRHGEVKGINKSYSSMSEYEEWIEKHFRKNPISLVKCTKQEKIAFSECISSLRVIPLIGSEKFVVEVDITPTFSTTKFMRFKIVQKKYPEGVYFVRYGSSSVPLSGKDLNDFLHSTISVEHRKDLEGSIRPVNMPQRLNKLLCKGEQKLDDNQFQYFLLMNRFCAEGCCNMKNYSDFDWITLVQWRAVFDFDSRTTEDGTWRILNDRTKVPVPPYHISGLELSDLLQKDSNGKVLTTMCEYGKKTLHISCCGDEEEFSSWREEFLSELTSLFRILTSPSLLEDASKLIFVVCACSDNRKKEIDAFLKAIFIKPQILNACCFIGNYNPHIQFIKDAIIQESFHTNGAEFFFDNSVIINWEELSAFVQQTQAAMTDKKYICTSTKGQTEIKPNVIDLFNKNGFSILPSNEGETLKDASISDLKDSFENTMRSFLQGKETTWEIFYYDQHVNDLALKEAIPSALIKRDIIKEIELKMQILLDDRNRCIATLGVGHLPGTGATTAVKHVLWKFKSSHRCVLLDGRILDDIDVKALAFNLLSFRALGEDDNVVKGVSKRTCLPLLMLLDNSSMEAAEHLQRKIQDEVHQRGIKFVKSIGIIFYVHNERTKSTNQVFLEASFSENEKRLFNSKLQQFRQIDIPLFDMLGFLSLMNIDDPKNYKEYVERVVDAIIETVRMSYPTELVLLLHLAIFKVFHEDGNLSVSHAKLIVGFGISNEKSFLENTCEYFNMLVKQYAKYEEGFGYYRVLEITHLPVAEIILKQLLKTRDQTLLEAMLEVIDNKVLIKHRFLQRKLIKDLVDIVVKRKWIETEHSSSSRRRHKTSLKKEQFSSFIQKIQDIRKEDGIVFLERFISVLEQIPNVDLDHNIGNVHQTLSRFHLTYKEFEKAKESAKEAIFKENSFAYFDTMGQIYKQELNSKLEIASNSEIDCNSILEIATNAVYNFRKTQEIGKTLYTKATSRDENVEWETNEEFLQRPGYLGEIQIIEIVAVELMKRVPSEHKEKLRQYISGNTNIRQFKQLSDVFDLNVHKYGSFLTKLQDRSHECFSVIMKDMDTKKSKSNTMDYILSILKSHTKIFLESSFSSLCDFLKKPKVPVQKKLQEIEKCCRWNMVVYWYCVAEMELKHLKLMRDIAEETYRLITTQKIDMDSFLKICMLNLNVSKLSPPILTFRTACKLSFDLTTVESEEYMQYEVFFWYILFHWPTPSEKEKRKQVSTYDEERILMCIQKLKSIQEKNAFYVQRRQERVRKTQQHSPLFFLKDGLEYDKFTDATYDRFKLVGNIRDKSNIEVILDGGTKIVIRAANLRYNRGSPAEKVKFFLGFTLSGPVAYQIETSDDYIQRLNESDAA